PSTAALKTSHSEPTTTTTRRRHGYANPAGRSGWFRRTLRHPQKIEANRSPRVEKSLEFKYSQGVLRKKRFRCSSPRPVAGHLCESLPVRRSCSSLTDASTSMTQLGSRSF